MKFDEVVGQAEVKQRLCAMVQSGRVPHALMFFGQEGAGGLPLALAFAQYLNCANKTADDSCGTCPSCLKNTKFIHPDVHFTFPVVKPESKRSPPVSADWINEWRVALARQPYMTVNEWLQDQDAENRQGNITADECREIIHHLQLKTFEEGYKIQIVWLAEYLAAEGNILLKILEEPPANTVFILVVENMELMLSTIISRTQRITIPPIDDADIQRALLQRFETDENTARKIARIADGSFIAAIDMAEGEHNANDKLLREWFGYSFQLRAKPSAENSARLFAWVEDFAKAGRENQKIFLRYALFFLRECLLMRVNGSSEKLEGDELTFAKNFSARLNTEQIEALSILLSNLHYHIERNGNPKVLFTANSFRIAAILQGELEAVED